jgi:hypothetical protein
MFGVAFLGYITVGLVEAARLERGRRRGCSDLYAARVDE